jgi:chromosome segregation ATPase
MALLNILQRLDGSLAWDNIAIVLLALVAGYLLHRWGAKNALNTKYAAIVAGWESKYKVLENEFKGYKSSLAAADKAAQKSLVDMTGRVKALEGDIRALSEEKNKFHHQVLSKDEDLKKYQSQLSVLEDRIKELRTEKEKSEASWSTKLQNLQAELTKATAWEHRVKSAEQEVHRSRTAASQAERKLLETELRLKATAEFAAKVAPLENELALAKQKCLDFTAELKNKAALVSELESKIIREMQPSLGNLKQEV